MGRLLKEKDIAPYVRGTGADWNQCYVNNTNKIAKVNDYNDQAWSGNTATNKLANESDFTKRSTYIEFLNPSAPDGHSPNWGIGAKFSLPLNSFNSYYKFTGTSTYSSSSTLFKPQYYQYCANSHYPTTITQYNSSGTGTTINVSSYVSDYTSIGCAYESEKHKLVLGIKMYFLKYGESCGYPKQPWEYLEYEGNEDFYDLAQNSDFIIGHSCLNKSYWPNNFSSYYTSPSNLNYYDARDADNGCGYSTVFNVGAISVPGNTFYTSNYDLMCLELAMMDVTVPAFDYYTPQRYVNRAATTDTAVRPCISPLAPEIGQSAEQVCCNHGKVNITPWRVITNYPSKGYVNNFKLLYAFKSNQNQYSSNPKRNEAIWATANTYGLFYVIPLIADNPYIYAPTTDLFALSNNRMGLYFHTGEAGSALPINKFLVK